MSDPTAPRPAPPPPDAGCAVFLDVDGCLLDIAPTPDGVVVADGLVETLARLSQRLDGALALVSGRSLAVLDALFAPLVLPAAGLHGLERRNGAERDMAPPAPPAMAALREEATRLAARFAGAVVEDKGVTLGLHWRLAPDAEDALQAFALAALPRLPGYRLQHGKQLVELRPAENSDGGGDKGTAITAFLSEPPFAGRRPVFAGDDLTDEAGFSVVNAHGGVSVLVGDRAGSAARHGLRDPADVHRWLHDAAGMPP
ncbi:MAG TPA: trehalose-phosphatase [Luteimonas sp.]|nr:trehalose-phosphatase [Luteimonas sp.]